MSDLLNSQGDSPDTSESSRRCKKLLQLFNVFNAPAGGEERYLVFIEVLNQLSPGEFDRAIAETLRHHRSSFLPTPGEILGYLERALMESRPIGSLARPDCPKCWGTGYTIIQLKNSQYAVAARCSCLAAAAKEGGRAN